MVGGFNAIEFQGAHAIAVKRGMDKGLQVVLGFLKEIAMPVSQAEEVENVCLVSSNYNERISSIISQVLMSVGLEGLMNIIESPTGLTDFKLVNGLVFSRGFVSPNFVQEEAGGNIVEQSIELDHPLVLVVANKIKHVEQILPIMELVKKAKRPLVLFSQDLQAEPASTMVYNSMKGIVSCAAVNIPWAGGVERDSLEDIAALTGATLVDNEHNLLLSEVELKHFGRAKHIKVTEYETSIVDGQGEKEAIEERYEIIKQQIKDEPKQQLKGVHQERLARLQSKIAEIWVGGFSEVERGEERDLIVDALNSAKSAIQGGVLPGGGVALYHASKLLEDGLPDVLSDPSEQLGAQILGKALKAPINQLVQNQEDHSAAHVLDKMADVGDFFTGYDIKSQQMCDMMDRGIYDSYNVVKVILEDSVSLAGMVVSTECILVKEKSYVPLSLKHY